MCTQQSDYEGADAFEFCMNLTHYQDHHQAVIKNSLHRGILNTAGIPFRE